MLSTFVRFLRWIASNLHLVVQIPQPRHLFGSTTEAPQPKQRAVSFLSCSSVKAFHSSVFIAMCNRVGTEGDMDFSGESIVVDPNGDTVIKADDTEQLVYADIDLSKATNIRRHRPYTTLRRPELYK